MLISLACKRSWFPAVSCALTVLCCFCCRACHFTVSLSPQVLDAWLSHDNISNLRLFPKLRKIMLSLSRLPEPWVQWGSNTVDTIQGAIHPALLASLQVSVLLAVACLPICLPRTRCHPPHLPCV